MSHLERHGIRFFVGNGGRVWTTLDAINQALQPESERKHKVEF